MPRRHPVIAAGVLCLQVLAKGAKLDAAVAQDVGIGGEAEPDCPDAVTDHPVPVVLCERHHVQFHSQGLTYLRERSRQKSEASSGKGGCRIGSLCPVT